MKFHSPKAKLSHECFMKARICPHQKNKADPLRANPSAEGWLNSNRRGNEIYRAALPARPSPCDSVGVKYGSVPTQLVISPSSCVSHQICHLPVPCDFRPQLLTVQPGLPHGLVGLGQSRWGHVRQLVNGCCDWFLSAPQSPPHPTVLLQIHSAHF